jgi:hypothetical protein
LFELELLRLFRDSSFAAADRILSPCSLDRNSEQTRFHARLSPAEQRHSREGGILPCINRTGTVAAPG